MTPAEFFERFGHLISKGGADECWPWTGDINNKGYGYVDFYGRGDGTRKKLLAHRMAAGTPKGKVTRHLCHNPPFCNPRHLAVGTQADNARDMIIAGRSRSRIRPDMVPALRTCISAGVSARTLAVLTGVSDTTINRIARGRSFSVLPGEFATEPRNVGSGHRNAKLTDDAVREIRRLRSAGVSQVEIAKQFNVTPQAIYLIVSRKAWKHVA